MKNPMLDQEFLRQLDLDTDKTLYGKIILLTNTEEPVEEIQGRITGGSVNIDGASAIRRTCSLTMVSEKMDINQSYWGLKHKFKLEIGMENNINTDYPKIIWFKQGVFVFTGLNISVQSNNFTINLNGKDKGCLLNGEIDGAFSASIDFGKLEEYQTLNNGEIVRNLIDIKIVDIIKNMLVAYAGEPMHNIIINDVDDYGLELLEYRGENPLYMPRNIDTGEVINMTTNENQTYLTEDGNDIHLSEIENFYNRTDFENGIKADVVYDNNGNIYNIIKIEFGETVGYRKTELTFPGDLIANVGETITSVLDKIKNMFADFEYFYDIDGHFVFQKKKTYMNQSFNSIEVSDNKTYAENAALTSGIAYSFEENNLLTAFTYSPNITNIKNDYSIWGKRKSASGAEIPIHLRYAIATKPSYYCSIDGKEFHASRYDWREIIYQMALDYFKYNHVKDDFVQLIAKNNPNHYPTGITGYEMFYTDMQGFWRQLYHGGMMDESLFSQNELKEIARELLLEERQFIQKENISQLFIDHIVKHYYDTDFIIYDDENETLNGKIKADKENNNIEIDESWLNYLYSMRQLKINNENLNTISNEDFVRCIVISIKEIETSNRELDANDLNRLVQNEIKIAQSKDATELQNILIKYVADNFNKKTMFKWDDKINKIVVIDPHVQYLLTLRETRVYEEANDTKYLTTYMLMHTICEALNGNSNSNSQSIQNAIETKIESVMAFHEPDYSAEMIRWMRDNYNIVTLDTEGNSLYPIRRMADGTVGIEHIYLYSLYVARQNKLDTIENRTYIKNSTFIKAMATAVETVGVGEENKYKFEEKIKELLESAVRATKSVEPVQEVTVEMNIEKFEAVTEEQVLDKVKNGMTEIKEYLAQQYQEDGWNRSVFTEPETLNFWFDFMNVNGEFGKYAIDVIGHRPKAINDDKVSAIYFEQTPTVLFINAQDVEDFQNNVQAYQNLTGYTLIRLNSQMENYFTISAQGKSAWDELNNLLNQHTNVAENITLTAVPIYHLQPNVRIFVKDNNTGTNGEYILTKITIPLQYNGTSSLSASKAVDRIY